MKVVTSKCEAVFVAEAICKGLRVDGRNLHDGRTVEITFGSDGCCIVMLDNTRVLAQVSCELTAPRPSRPAEGALNVNLELSPMAAPNFQSGRMSDAGIEASRLLERGVRDSKCIDLESLCVVAGSKVWTIRVDVQALNDDGNLTECASIATIAALAHFKRPHVSVIGTEVTVHSLEDHNPVPLTLHHMPVIISLALYDRGNVVVVDAVELEERVAEGKIVIGVNAHQEICSLHLSGAMMLKKDKVLCCTNIAVKRAQMLTKRIREALEKDAYQKTTNEPTGFAQLIRTSTILGAKHTINQITLSNEVIEVDDDDDVKLINVESDAQLPEKNLVVKRSRVKEVVHKFLRKPEVALFEGGTSRWNIEDDDEDEESENSENEVEVLGSGNDQEQKTDDESDEDKPVYLKAEHVDMDAQTAESRGWYKSDTFM